MRGEGDLSDRRERFWRRTGISLPLLENLCYTVRVNENETYFRKKNAMDVKCSGRNGLHPSFHKEEMDMLETGIKAPDFELPDQNGIIHRLEDYRGKKVILYFYPKDSTPGCTKQACGFGELYPQFLEKGAVVLGVSKDSVKSHKKFEEKYGLPFTLLSDTELAAIQAYDVWQEKKMYGKVSMGVVRTTYLIDEEGRIVKAYGKVKAAENPQQMLEELDERD